MKRHEDWRRGWSLFYPFIHFILFLFLLQWCQHPLFLPDILWNHLQAIIRPRDCHQRSLHWLNDQGIPLHPLPLLPHLPLQLLTLVYLPIQTEGQQKEWLFVGKEPELAMIPVNTVGKCLKTVLTWQSIGDHILERSHTNVNSAPMLVLKVLN